MDSYVLYNLIFRAHNNAYGVVNEIWTDAQSLNLFRTLDINRDVDWHTERIILEKGEMGTLFGAKIICSRSIPSEHLKIVGEKVSWVCLRTKQASEMCENPECIVQFVILQ